MFTEPFTGFMPTLWSLPRALRRPKKSALGSKWPLRYENKTQKRNPNFYEHFYYPSFIFPFRSLFGLKL
jgi:hypothetical protein